MRIAGIAFIAFFIGALWYFKPDGPISPWYVVATALVAALLVVAFVRGGKRRS